MFKFCQRQFYQMSPKKPLTIYTYQKMTNCFFLCIGQFIWLNSCGVGCKKHSSKGWGWIHIIHSSCVVDAYTTMKIQIQQFTICRYHTLSIIGCVERDFQHVMTIVSTNLFLQIFFNKINMPSTYSQLIKRNLIWLFPPENAKYDIFLDLLLLLWCSVSWAFSEKISG